MKKIAIAGIGVFLVIIAIVLFLFTQGNEQDKQSVLVEIPKPVTTSDPGVSIVNYSTYGSRITSQDQESIETLIYANIPQVNKDAKINYQASIKDDNFISTSDSGAATTSFLVDIPMIKTTYKLLLGNDAETGENSINIACAEANETTYDTSSCKAEELSR